MSFNTIIDWNSCTAEQQRQLLMRPAISASESITRTVNDILDNVKARGDDACGNTARSLIKPRLPH
ncbi:Histidinol dehydrogenase [Escherichia coli ISC7]|uniref:Histidinol dehydrogenase n=1 Tax=Escherichia coli ISC7 TaxID=1432555 RepID=W1F3S5_ECOLX|nr:Histidinol dehydrogenase [Escherichia coli ISC7]